MEKTTAKQAYEERKNEIGALLDAISQETKMHAEYAEKDGLNWGHAGDLAHVRQNLIETLAFLSQRDEADIQHFLNEMKG